MLIYADHTVSADPGRLLRAALAKLRTLAESPPVEHDDLTAALDDAGVCESGIADAICDARDAAHPVLLELRRASEALGGALAASWLTGTGAGQGLRDAAAALERVQASRLPPSVELRTPEGTAFYAVYPEAYMEAALEWTRAHAPERVICLGLRSIGTSLSAAVHGALVLAGVDAGSWTLRPRGHPFHRFIAVAPELVRRWTPDRSTFLIIDEGPGLSGSSLAGTAAWLSDMGVPDDRIVLLAAWNADAERLCSESARHVWRRHAVLTGSFERVRDRVLEASHLPPGAADVSAGRWRQALPPERPWPPSHPQHERIKLLTPDGRLVRFAGLGRYGKQAYARAERLAAGGWTTTPLALHRGFLSLEYVAGLPMRARDVDDAFLRHAAEYVAWLRRHEPTGVTAPIDSLADMLRVNIREGLDAKALKAADDLIAHARAFAEPAVALDGRLLPHEWLRTPNGFLKTDALDHHRDHFLPGPADAAWDVAGLIVENGLAGGPRERLLTAYVRASGDAGVGRRLPFYTAAYAAFRLGYCAMAEASVDEEERRRFATARARYTAALRRAITER